ncbi:MAG: hypothetical protein SVU88_03415 [Candidatus Nanohaloarchaea archaeon]|nr:hypothetical protein [Candidatus Nanohaloarchaea archaeon]
MTPDVCGEPTRSGDPCQRPPAWGREDADEGPCKAHAEETVEKWKARAREAADILEDELISLQKAANRADISIPKLHRLRKQYPEIGRRVDEALEANLQARGTAMEDAVFQQVLEGEASGNLTKFMLKNYLDRFDDEQKVEHSGAVGRFDMEEAQRKMEEEYAEQLGLEIDRDEDEEGGGR